MDNPSSRSFSASASAERLAVLQGTSLHVFRWLALARLKGDGFAASRTLDHLPLARLADEVAIRSLGDAFEVHRVDVRGAERSTD